MSHAAAKWCSERHNKSPLIPLTHIEARSLSDQLIHDAENYCYSALVCIADACHAMQDGFYSWATAKLYYSTFYSIRGMLAMRGFGIFYYDEKPMIIEAVAGASFRKPSKSESKGGTHGLVQTVFSNKFYNHILLSQPINGIPGPRWMKERREEVNYGSARYFEPKVPRWMNSIDHLGIRKSLNAYLSDDNFLYSFDEDHAILAFPIFCARNILKDINDAGKGLSEEDTQFLAQKVVDDAGPISGWTRFIREQ